METSEEVSQIRVAEFRAILLWPLQLAPSAGNLQVHKHWELMEQAGTDSPWREVVDEITGDSEQFQERHYSEFVTFLPNVQRILYGEGQGAASRSTIGEPRTLVFRRKDIAKARLTYTHEGASETFDVAHVDLYFFLDVDIVILAFEIFTEDIELSRAQDTLFRFGRVYPPYWDEDGGASQCLKRVEWLSQDGDVLAASDYDERDQFISFVRTHRSPRIASHWEFVLNPLVPDYAAREGLIRYRQVAYHRMPVLAYLAVDDPNQLTRADFVRLGLVAGPGPGGTLPYADDRVRDFEQRYCLDRYWGAHFGRMSRRFMCSGRALVVVGNRNEPHFVDGETGVLGQFRHQHFLLFLIAHFHKVSLLMLSGRMASALNTLDIRNSESVRQFKRTARRLFEAFLRFKHRYWFHDISEQTEAKALFRMCVEDLETDRLNAEVREGIHDMADFLDSDSLRRLRNALARLTVVIAASVVALICIGFLGINLIAERDTPLPLKLAYFLLVILATLGLMFYVTRKSKRLSDFLESLAEDRSSLRRS